MSMHRDTIWAVIPVKETAKAKQRLASILCAADRQNLARAMFEDVLAAVSTVEGLAGIVVATVDPVIETIAKRAGAQVSTAAARVGLTEAITAAAGELAAEGHGMLAIPADIPLVTAADIRTLLSAHRVRPTFTIVPARDFKGTNAIVMSPARAVPLQFGPDSFYLHLAAAQAAGITPCIHRCAAIELDIDTSEDFATLQDSSPSRRVSELLAEWSERQLSSKKEARQ